jgi:hypothetical protein
MKKNGNNHAKGNLIEGKTTPKYKSKIESKKKDRIHSKCIFMVKKP